MLNSVYYFMYLQTVNLTATEKDDPTNEIQPTSQVFIIHIPEDHLCACWVKERRERFGHGIAAHTFAELWATHSDTELLKDFLVQSCDQGAICLFYVSKDCNENTVYNDIKERLLMYSIHKNNYCVTPVWDDPEARKAAPYDLICFTGVQVQSPKLVQVISLMLKDRQGMCHVVKQ